MKPIALVHRAEGRLCQLRVVGSTLTESTRPAGYFDADGKGDARVELFDSAALAEGAAGARLEALVAAGWQLSDGQALHLLLADHAPWATWARLAQSPSTLTAAWSALGDPVRVAALVERVTAIEVTDGALELALGERGITCALPLAPALVDSAPPSLRSLLALHGGLWLDDDTVMAGWGFGPPEGDAELEGTALEVAPVTWFLTEGTSRFALATRDGLYRFEHDGGLEVVPADRTPGSLVLEAILTALDEG